VTDRPHVADWATDWDHLGRQYHEEAVAVWEELRGRCPVAHTPRFGGAWLAVNYADVMAVTHDTATFSSRETNLYDVRPQRLLVMPPISLDPPEQTSYRQLLLPMFTPSAVEHLAPQVEALCHRLIDAFIDTGHADAGGDYAQHVPVLMTARLLGLPESDADRFRAWIHDMIERGQSEPEVGAQAIRELLSYFREQLAHRRENPGDDVTSLLANAEVNGEPLDERTRAAMLLLMLIGGVDTTWTALGASLWHLATHPEDQARLRQQPELLDTALEEFLRFYSPVEIGRIATRDTMVGGCPIAEGDRFWLAFPAANRDPVEFPDADQFVIDRQPNRHVAFGVGAHRCLGSNLARMEMKVAIATWLQRVPPFRLRADTTVEWTTGGNVRGPRVIPITF
jgi:cytochrome P450